MIEVEIKIRTDLDSAGEKLTDNGFIKDRFIKESDIYYDNAAGDIRGNDTALRIRTVEYPDLGTSESYITFKGSRCDDVSMTRPEYESLIKDPGEIKMILKALGYGPVEPAVIKERTLYVKGSVSACLDRVEELGDFLELEIMSENESKDDALNRLWKMLGLLGYNREDTITVSYLTMLQENLKVKK